MGATLPLLVRFIKARDEVAGFQVGRHTDEFTLMLSSRDSGLM